MRDVECVRGGGGCLPLHPLGHPEGRWGGQCRSGQWEVWKVGNGHWTVSSGQRGLDSGKWVLDSGEWKVGSGQWTGGCGHWTVDSGGKQGALD